jgi:hypothetical protein
MLRAAYDRIKARVAEATVAMGGVMSPDEHGWIERVLATPGADAAHAFDIANLHLRGRASALPRQLAAWRELLGRRGFGGTGVGDRARLSSRSGVPVGSRLTAGLSDRPAASRRGALCSPGCAAPTPSRSSPESSTTRRSTHSTMRSIERATR